MCSGRLVVFPLLFRFPTSPEGLCVLIKPGIVIWILFCLFFLYRANSAWVDGHGSLKNDSDSAAGFKGDTKKLKCDELKASQNFAAELGGYKIKAMREL